jgi:hypothetical protein
VHQTRQRRCCPVQAAPPAGRATLVSYAPPPFSFASVAKDDTFPLLILPQVFRRHRHTPVARNRAESTAPPPLSVSITAGPSPLPRWRHPTASHPPIARRDLAGPTIGRPASHPRQNTATARELIRPLVAPLLCGTAVLGTLPGRCAPLWGCPTCRQSHREGFNGPPPAAPRRSPRHT